jgi:hypothetical protein
MAMNGYKITLSTGKTVLIRRMEISDYEMACEGAGMRYTTELGQKAAVGKELLKALLVKVNDQPVSALQREALNDVFEVKEFMELMEVVNKTTGIGEKKAKPTVEVVNIGEKSPGSHAIPASPLNT